MAKVWWGVALLLVCLIGAAVLIGCWRFRRPLPAIVAVPHYLQPVAASQPNLSWPSAPEAAIGAAGFGLLASNGSQSPRPTASVAKIITALAVLNKYPLHSGSPGPTLTFDDTDVQFYNQYVAEDGSVVPVHAGDRLTEYQALEAMLLPSANNMADSLARWAYGSLSNYTTAANQLLKGRGINQTTVGTDASGFDPSTVSTAADLVKLGLRAMQDPTLAQIVGEPKASLPVGAVTNTNALLDQNNIIGVKTGNTDQAGGVFIGASRQSVGGHAITIVSAVIGSANLGDALNQSAALLASVAANFKPSLVAKAGTVAGTYQMPWGGSVSAVIQKDVSLVAWKGAPPQLNLKLLNLHSPVAARTVVGSANTTAGGLTVSSPIVIQQTVQSPSIWWRISRK